MSNNCLVTKLKASVNNDSLDKLGMFSVFFKQEASPTQDTRYIRIVSSEKNTILVTGGLLYKVYGGTSIGNSYTLTDDDWNAAKGGYVFSGYISNDECRLDIPKYTFMEYNFKDSAVKNIAITKFDHTLVTSFSGRFLTGRVSDFPDNAVHVSINGNTNVSGSLADFARMTAIRTLNTGNSSIEASTLSSIGTLTALTKLQVVANGSIENFVGAQRANGRTTCDGITCAWLGAGNITFNGEQIVNKASATLSWTADTITYDGTTITA